MSQFVSQRSIRVGCIVGISLMILICSISGSFFIPSHIDRIKRNAIRKFARFAQRIVLAVAQTFNLRIAAYLIRQMTDAQRGAVFIGLLEGIYHHIDVVVLVPAVLYIIFVLHEALAVELRFWNLDIFHTRCTESLAALILLSQFELDMQVLARDGIHLIVVYITLIKFVHIGENLLEAGIFDVLRGVTVEDMEDDRQMINIIIARNDICVTVLPVGYDRVADRAFGILA